MVSRTPRGLQNRAGMLPHQSPVPSQKSTANERPAPQKSHVGGQPHPSIERPATRRGSNSPQELSDADWAVMPLTPRNVYFLFFNRKILPVFLILSDLLEFWEHLSVLWFEKGLWVNLWLQEIKMHHTKHDCTPIFFFCVQSAVLLVPHWVFPPI